MSIYQSLSQPACSMGRKHFGKGEIFPIGVGWVDGAGKISCIYVPFFSKTMTALQTLSLSQGGGGAFSVVNLSNCGQYFLVRFM